MIGDSRILPRFSRKNTERSNYRPVSLTSILSKVLESIIRDEFMEHLVNNSLISEEQHGFVPRKNCITNLLETLDFISDALSNGHSVDEVMLDLSKAFDLVPHKRLVHKIKGYGVTNELAEWFEDFLRNREQRVVFEETLAYGSNYTFR